MYSDNAWYEYYPAEIVDKVFREHPDATAEQKHRLMQAEWDSRRPPQQSMAELADAMGFPTKPNQTSMAELADELGL
jgi:hypothetical protein